MFPHTYASTRLHCTHTVVTRPPPITSENLYELMLFLSLSKIAVELCRIISALYITYIRPTGGAHHSPAILACINSTTHTPFCAALTVSLSSSTIFPRAEPPNDVYTECALAPDHHPGMARGPRNGRCPPARSCSTESGRQSPILFCSVSGRRLAGATVPPVARWRAHLQQTSFGLPLCDPASPLRSCKESIGSRIRATLRSPTQHHISVWPRSTDTLPIERSTRQRTRVHGVSLVEPIHRLSRARVCVLIRHEEHPCLAALDRDCW